MTFAHRMLVAVLLMLFTRFAAAEAIDQVIEELLVEPTKMVTKWEHYAQVAFYLVVAVGIVGICTTVVQLIPLSPVSTKILTGVFGALVGAFTVIGNSFLEFDHRQYDYLATIGRQSLSEIRLKRLTLKDIPVADLKSRNELLEGVREDARKVIALAERTRSEHGGFQERARPKSEKSEKFEKIEGSFFVGTAFAGGAEGGLPEWAVSVPSDETNLYFVGYGDGKDFVSARQSSRDRAYEDARQYLSDRLGAAARGPLDSDALAGYLLESARVLTTYYIFDKGNQTYRFYSLLGLSRKIANSDLRVFVAKNSVSGLQELDTALRGASRSQSDYISTRLSIYRGQSVKAEESIGRKQYDDYIKARDLRLDDKGMEAIGILRELVRAKPDFYLAWFNLALALDEEKRLEEARQAYERAIGIARKEGIKDASLYNSYGYLLYRMKKFPEAIAMLETAIQFAPDHPKVRGTLAAAKAGR